MTKMPPHSESGDAAAPTRFCVMCDGLGEGRGNVLTSGCRMDTQLYKKDNIGVSIK